MSAAIIRLAGFQSLETLRRLIRVAEMRYEANPTLDNFGAMVTADANYDYALHGENYSMDGAG